MLKKSPKSEALTVEEMARSLNNPLTNLRVMIYDWPVLSLSVRTPSKRGA